MLQNPAHRQAPPNAAAVAQQGPHVGPPRNTLRCSGGTRGGVRGQQLQEICGARHLPEPPRLQEASSRSRGRVRVLQPRPSRHSLRRNPLRTAPPLRFTLRRSSLLLLRRLPPPSHKQPRLLPPISNATPLNQTRHNNLNNNKKNNIVCCSAIQRRMLRRWQRVATMVHPVVPASNSIAFQPVYSFLLLYY